LGAGVAEQDVLLVVVPEHEIGDLVGHRREEGVAFLEVETT
jgi:hypothetical protein